MSTPLNSGDDSQIARDLNPDPSERARARSDEERADHQARCHQHPAGKMVAIDEGPERVGPPPWCGFQNQYTSRY